MCIYLFAQNIAKSNSQEDYSEIERDRESTKKEREKERKSEEETVDSMCSAC